MADATPEPLTTESDWTDEHYTAHGEAHLAQVLLDTGLLAQINAAVLHQHGIAMGVAQDADGKVTSIFLSESADPAGIYFDAEQTAVLRGKLRAAGLLRQARVYPLKRRLLEKITPAAELQPGDLVDHGGRRRVVDSVKHGPNPACGVTINWHDPETGGRTVWLEQANRGMGILPQ